MRYKELVGFIEEAAKQGLHLEKIFRKSDQERDRMRHIKQLGFEVDYEDFFELLQEPSSSKDILEEVSVNLRCYRSNM